MWCWATRLTPDISDEAMLLPLILSGFGAGWQIGPVSSLINSQTPNLLLGEGMELYLCQRQLGGSWGIAILTIIVDRERKLLVEPPGRIAEPPQPRHAGCIAGRLGDICNDWPSALAS